MEMIKNNNGLSDQEITLLRERFVNEYSKKKGWNPKELSTTQMLEIVNERGYKNAGLILG